MTLEEGIFKKPPRAVGILKGAGTTPGTAFRATHYPQDQVKESATLECLRRFQLRRLVESEGRVVAAISRFLVNEIESTNSRES
jgi:hypothetical protein